MAWRMLLSPNEFNQPWGVSLCAPLYLWETELPMKNNSFPTLRAIGKIVLGVGILTLIVGLLLLLFAASSFAGWMIVASIIINIVGITLITLRTY